jgi:hypothetical protein
MTAKRIGRIAAALAVCVGVGLSGAARAQVYNEWNNPDSGAAAAPDPAVERMIRRLNELIDQAERDRAADPAFLNDLRAAIEGREDIWGTTVLSDDFMDGNYTEDPRWLVVAGRWWVERGWGLRAALKTEEETPQTSSDQPPTNKLTGEEVFGAVLSTILQGSSQARQKVEADAAGTNTIVHDVRIANAFSASLDVTSWVKGGRFEIAVYQGDSRESGYVLAYEPEGAIEMLRVSGRGTAVIDRAPGPFSLEDEQQHALVWTRDASGAMSVSLDGAQVFTVSDRGFRDPFDGVRLSAAGADVIVKSITVDVAN